MTANLILPWSRDYDDYLSDESKSVGEADSISFPTSEAQVVEVVRAAREMGRAITTQGARTGIVAGAVPHGGHVLNLSRMKAIGDVRRDDGITLTAQPGALLSEIRERIEPEGLFFPPDPTEATCSIGGMVSTNASGAITFHYGPTRDWVRAIRVVLADGSALGLVRGENRARCREFAITTEAGRVISGRLPSYTPPSVKSAAGYFVADDMDLIDLFIGSEGTLGIVTEIDLRLIKRPAFAHALTVFVPSEDAALAVVRAARGEEGETPAARPVAIEFFNHDALDLLRRMKSESAAFEKIPALKDHYHTAVYIEFHGDDESALEESALQVVDLISRFGSTDDDTWYATTEREIEPIKAFRHAIPEAVNLLIGERKRSCPDLTKLGTDMSVPNERLADAMAMYNADLVASGLESVIFGHIGNNHVHVNILPNSIEEYQRGESLYLDWARRVVGMGGSVSAEHGIGKLKAPFLELMYGPKGIAEMRVLRSVFDPDGVLNPGNLF